MNTAPSFQAVHWQPALQRADDVAPGPDIVAGIADIEQAIAIILRTALGSDPLRPEFGSAVHDYLDWPLPRALPHLVRETFRALQRWEPRIELVRVSPEPDNQGARVILRVFWKLADGVLRETGVSL